MFTLEGPYSNMATYPTWLAAFVGLLSIIRERSLTAGCPLGQVWWVFSKMRIYNWDKVEKMRSKGCYPLTYYEDVLATYNANPVLHEQCQALGIHLVGDNVYFMDRFYTLVNLAVMEGNAQIVRVDEEIEY